MQRIELANLLGTGAGVCEPASGMPHNGERPDAGESGHGVDDEARR